MDYLEALNDPLKHYFKERIGALYTNTRVMEFLVEKAQKGEKESYHVPSDAFIKSSPVEKDGSIKNNRIQSKFKAKGLNKKRKKLKRKNSIDLHEKNMTKAKAVNPNKLSSAVFPDTGVNRLEQDLEKFVRNNSVVKSNLDMQWTNIECKVYARKQKGVIKGELSRII